MKRKGILFICALIMTWMAICPVIAQAAVTPAVVELNLTSAVIDMANSSTLRLSAEVLPEDASQRVTWSTSNSSVAKVSSNGTVTARKRGTAVITATAYKTKVVARCTVTVINHNLPDSIDIGASSLTLLRYETRQLSARVLPATANQQVKWKSSRSSVVSVSSNGLITAKKAGTSTITCYSAKDKTILDTVSVTVHQQDTPRSIEISPYTDVMVVGDTLKLTGKQSPANACGFFEWKTSSSSRATVSADGVVTAKKTGWVTITCRSKQKTSVKDTLKILVVSESSPHRIQLSAKDLSLYAGDTYQISASVQPQGKDTRLKYKSSRTSVVAVSDSGFLTAKKAGTATITVTSRANSNVEAKISVKVSTLPAPSSLKISAASSTVAKGKTLQLYVAASPAKTSSEVKWKSSNTSVAKVSSTGLVTGRKGGQAVITATSSKNSKVKATFTVSVSDDKSPTQILVDTSVFTLEVNEKRDLDATVLPATASQGIKWTTSNSSVAKVDSKGVVTGRKGGTAVITAVSTYNGSIGGSAMVTVVTRSTPSSLSASYGKNGLALGETAQITVTPSPSTASRLVKYSSSNRSVVTVSETGLLTAKKVGTATITITSGKKSSIKTTLKVTVYDETTPRSLALSTTIVYLGEDDTMTLTPTILPENAQKTVSWTSNNSAVASVSSEGRITAKKSGTAIITCTTKKGGLTASCTVHVLDTTLATVIPERTTNVSGIAANLARIEAIRRSAVNQVLSLARYGKISSSEASARQAIIERAFEMQAFPWMTKKVQEYWSSAYAYKRYLPDTVYYGLPYIQTGPHNGYLNRRYNVAKAVQEGRYTATGKGYYLLNQDKLVDGMYCGNDCSAFVSISQFGTNHPASYLNTTAIAKSTFYRTISGYDKLKPGDLMVKSGDHTVLFLYYVDALKTRMMIIEQGGNGSTVICSIYNTSYFSSRGYVARRQTSFAAN